LLDALVNFPEFLTPSGRRDFTGQLLGGRYQIHAKIGHGGQGAVYRATDQ
jgi:hypothetical protein